MPDFEFEFNQQDKELVVSQDAGTFGGMNYIRLTIYPTEAINNIVDLPDETKGIDGKAIFFSSLNDLKFYINIAPFRDLTGLLNEINGLKLLGGTTNEFQTTDGDNDFQIYRNETTQDIYIKPNEIFNKFELPQGNYKIQIDFLNQIVLNMEGSEYLSTLPFPEYYEEFDVDNNGSFTGFDLMMWNTYVRPDIRELLAYLGTSTEGQIENYIYPDYALEWNSFSDIPTGASNNDSSRFFNTTGTEIGSEGGFEQYQFIIKQISTSRKEVRLKLLDKSIVNNSLIIKKLTSEFNNFEPEFLDDNVTPNPNYKYQFKHILNIGTGDHNPIMNYAFDAVTDGKDNQSIILKLYEPLPTNVGNLSMVTIEREVLTTQIQDIFYFSDVPDVFFGDGLPKSNEETWINPDGNDLGFQNLDEIVISSSIGGVEVDSLISSSQYGYPNLNTDFRFFENHTFFGSAKRN